MDRRRTFILVSLLAPLLASSCTPRDEAVTSASPKAAVGSSASAAPVPPPPPPPPPLTQVAVTLLVEFPDGRVVEARADGEDCPGECGWYTINGFVDAAFRKAGVDIRKACTGPSHQRACEITAIDGVVNSKSGRWVMFRNGHRNPYPYNQITHDSQPQRIVYRFLSSSDPNP